MTGQVEIKGGAGVFEAAVIAVVLDHINAEEKALRTGRDSNDNRLPSWVTVLNRTQVFPAPTSHPAR